MDEGTANDAPVCCFCPVRPEDNKSSAVRLLECKANPNHEWCGKPLSFIAIELEKPNTLIAMIECKADIETSKSLYKRASALHTAVRHDNIDCFRILCDNLPDAGKCIGYSKPSGRHGGLQRDRTRGQSLFSGDAAVRREFYGRGQSGNQCCGSSHQNAGDDRQMFAADPPERQNAPLVAVQRSCYRIGGGKPRSHAYAAAGFAAEQQERSHVLGACALGLLFHEDGTIQAYGRQRRMHDTQTSQETAFGVDHAARDGRVPKPRRLRTRAREREGLGVHSLHQHRLPSRRPLRIRPVPSYLLPFCRVSPRLCLAGGVCGSLQQAEVLADAH